MVDVSINTMSPAGKQSNQNCLRNSGRPLAGVVKKANGYKGASSMDWGQEKKCGWIDSVVSELNNPLEI